MRANTAAIADAHSALPVHAGKALAVISIAPPSANAISFEAQDVAALFFAVTTICLTAVGIFGAGVAVGFKMARLFQSTVAES